MADVEAALAEAAAEDGGALFECRPHGLPPGKVGRILAVVVIVAPFLAGAWDLLALRVRGRDHGRRWSASWSSLQLHVDDERGTTHSAYAHGPAWGPASPLLKGVDVPWLLLGALGFATLELLRYARYRSRRIAVTPSRVLVAEGIVGVDLRAWQRPERPTLIVRRGDAALWSTRPLHLGRLDPLDLIELAAKVGSVPPRPAPPRGRWWGLGLAAAALAGLVVVVALAHPWSGTLRIERGADSFADQVTLTVDGPAWGSLRTLAPLHDRTSAVVPVPGYRLEGYLLSGGLEGLLALPGPARHVACVVARVDADARPAMWVTHALQGATNGLLRRVEVTSLQVLESTPEHRRRTVPPRQIRVAGRLLLVKGAPLPFDVTLGAGEGVTLDLGELRERAR